MNTIILRKTLNSGDHGVEYIIDPSSPNRHLGEHLTGGALRIWGDLKIFLQLAEAHGWKVEIKDDTRN